MVVQHNMQALNANRMLGITTGSQAKSAEKLSSGYRINRAADDAAGLSISEKMRKQIRGLDRASANAQDGISCVQTAEGALTEVTSMLQRMNELAVQSANGTNSEDDRTAIQNEIDQLADEIDRVSETTKFNETYLLKGTGEAKTSTAESGVKATTRAGLEKSSTMAEATGNIYKGTITSTLGKGTEDTVTVSYTDKLGDAYTKEVKFTVGADANETAANIAAAINADELLKNSFTATANKDGLSIESNANYYDLQELANGSTAYQITGLTFGSAEAAGPEAKLQTNMVDGAAEAATGNTYTLDITDLKAGDTVTIDGTTYTFDPDKAGDTNKTHSFSTAQELLDRLGADYDVSASLTYQATVYTNTSASESGLSINGGNTSTTYGYSLNTSTENVIKTGTYDKNSKLTVDGASGASAGVSANYSAGSASASTVASASGSSTVATDLSYSASTGSYELPDSTATSAMKIALKITKKTAPEETKTTTSKEALSLNFHVGADSSSENKINVKIDSMDATTLGIRNSAGKALDLSTEEGATAAIDTISEALKKVSAQRSSLGAIQNRLEHTISNLDNVVENTTSAESAIRDTDMAEEMVEYSKNNILAQAGQSMLAQANQSTQGVLSLLG